MAKDITNSITALKQSLANNEEFYINGDISEEQYLYMRQHIEQQLVYYSSLLYDY